MIATSPRTCYNKLVIILAATQYVDAVNLNPDRVK